MCRALQLPPEAWLRYVKIISWMKRIKVVFALLLPFFDQDLAAPRLLDLLGHPARREGSYQVPLAFFKEKSLI